MESQIHTGTNGDYGVTAMPDFLNKPLLKPTQSMAKDVAFAALVATTIASSTIIEPVIATPIDTVVSVEGSGPQGGFTYELLKQAEAISAASSTVLTEVYSIDDPSAVERYLENNSELIEPLNVIAAELTKASYVGSVSLELYRDSEEHWEKLFVVATSTIVDVDELIALEDELFLSFFQPKTDDLSGRVALSVE